MKPYVIIVAGGKGLRMGSDLPKQFIPVAGKPLLMHTVEKFGDWNPDAEIILVLPADHQPYWKMLCKEIGCRAKHRIVTGGETRFHSVRNGLEVIRAEIGEGAENVWVAVHDGVRPFVSTEVITACFDQAKIKEQLFLRCQWLIHYEKSVPKGKANLWIVPVIMPSTRHRYSGQTCYCVHTLRIIRHCLPTMHLLSRR